MIYLGAGAIGLIVGAVFTFFMMYPSYRRGYYDGKASKIKKDVLNQIYNEAFDDVMQGVYKAIGNIKPEEYDYDGD